MPRLQRRRAGERPRGALPGRVGIPAPEPLGGGERRHGGRGPYPRARHRGQDRHRADHREVEGHARPGPRLVRRVRAGEEPRGRRGRAGGARRQGWGGRRADRAEDPERDLLREGRGDRGPRLMLRVDRRLLQNVDWVLFATACALVVVSVLALVVVACLDYRRLVRAAPALYLLGLGGLALVYALGRSVSGARRWIVLGPISVQPSELFKVFFVLMAVWVITSRWAQPVGRTTLVMTLPIAAVPFALIIKQPDLGTALLLFPVLMILLV